MTPYMDDRSRPLHYITIVIPKQRLFSTVMGRFSTVNDSGLAGNDIWNRAQSIYGVGLPNSKGSKQGLGDANRAGDRGI